MPKLDEYMTIRQAAKYLGVSANTLRNWGADGKISVHRNPMNGYRLFKIVELDKLLKNVECSANRPRKAR